MWNMDMQNMWCFALSDEAKSTQELQKEEQCWVTIIDIPVREWIRKNRDENYMIKMTVIGENMDQGDVLGFFAIRQNS